MGSGAKRIATIVLVGASLGCSSLLPSSDATDSPFRSFSGAFEAFAAIVPGETRVSELKALEIDPARRGVTVRPYTSVAEVLLPHEGTPDELHPPTVAACIEARSRCEVWLLDIERLKRRRVGNWFVDASRFRRNREVDGFLFSGVLLVLDDVAIYKLWAGIPRIDIQRTEINPLGPFNDANLPRLEYRMPIPGLSSSIRTATQPRRERKTAETARDAQAMREAERARRRGHRRKGPGI